jgi:rhamnulokinase
MTSPLFIAVDLGAGSGRVFLAGIGREELLLEEIRRFQYPPRIKDGNLRWDFWYIFEEIKSGLRQAAARSNELGRDIQSIGIDSWAVDYGLIDSNGDLISDPVSYRDRRTATAMSEVFERVPSRTIFERTGIQFQSFNTVYQLWSEREKLGNASKMLLLPDLINFFLTGRAGTEFTNATTTQMVNASSGTWDANLLERLGLPAQILTDVIPAGTDLGKLKPEIAVELGMPGVHVIATATHDTASAVAAAPITQDWAYISSGTWSLIGVERDKVLINCEAERQNFTNEGGACQTFRFLKNVMGLWILERCRNEWKERGVDVTYDALISGLSEYDGFTTFIYPDDDRFLNPPSMIGAMREQSKETGQEFDGSPVVMAKIIFDSLAFRYASVLKSIESITGRRINAVQILGGGGRNSYLNQMTANASGLKVRAGLPEATVVGNVLVQSISAGRFGSLSEARSHVAENFTFQEFLPESTPEITKGALRYAEIENHFLSNVV